MLRTFAQRRPAMLKALALFATGIGLLAILFSAQRYAWQQARRAQWETLPRDEIVRSMREMAESSPPDWSTLVAALASERAEIASAAQQVVLEELDRFQQHSPARREAAYRALAAQLAADIQRYGPTTRRYAGFLAEQMLRNPVDTMPSAARAEWVAQCGQVLRVASRETRDPVSADVDWRVTPRPIPWEQWHASHEQASPAGDASLTAAEDAQPVADDKKPSAAAPENVLAEEKQTTPLHDKSDQPAQPAPTTTAALEPRPLPELTGAPAAPHYERPDSFRKPLELRRLSKQPAMAMEPTDSNAVADKLEPRSLNDGGTTRENPLRRDVPRRNDRSSGPPRDGAVIELLQQLVAADQQAANRAATALAERGLPPAQMELARRLADPDPEVRKSLVKILPRTPGLDARPWLWWLAQDEHADVRLAALSFLATSNDPRVWDQVEARAREDRDERILALAERLRKRRK